MNTIVPHNIFVPFTDETITDTALLARTEHGYWVSALHDCITQQDLRKLSAYEITKKSLAETYNECVYVVVFTNGRIKIGRSANPIQRCVTYVADSGRFGVGVQRCWISPRLRARNVADVEKSLLQYAQIQGTCVYGVEYFVHPDANCIIAFALHNLPIASHSAEIKREDTLHKYLVHMFSTPEQVAARKQVQYELDQWTAPTSEFSPLCEIFDTLTDVVLDDTPGNLERMRTNACNDADVINTAVLDLVDFENRPILTDLFPDSLEWYVTLRNMNDEHHPYVVMRSRELWETFRSRTQRPRMYDVQMSDVTLIKAFSALSR